MTVQERDLLALVGIYAGDPRALGELFDRYTPLLHSVASAIVNRPEDADDVVRQTWRIVWTRSTPYDRRKGSVALWLLQLVRDRARERVKGAREPAEAERLVLSTLHKPGTAAPAAESDLMAHELARAALERLTPLERQTLAAALFEALTFDEIAARLEVTPDTVRQWMRHGLESLRDVEVVEEWA
jgi:RNA polymerase sigma-70 factor (ECF subfamily)